MYKHIKVQYTSSFLLVSYHFLLVLVGTITYGTVLVHESYVIILT